MLSCFYSSKIASAKNKNEENVLQKIAGDEAEAFLQGQAATAASITFLGLAQSELSNVNSAILKVVTR